MAQLGLKNISKKNFCGTFDGKIYEFKVGELRLIDSEIAMHLQLASNQAAIGGYALKIVKESDIPEELRKEPETKMDSLMGIKSDRGLEMMFDGKIFKFPKGQEVFLHKSVAMELISRSMENGKPTLIEVVAKPKEEAKPETKKKEGK